MVIGAGGCYPLDALLRHDGCLPKTRVDSEILCAGRERVYGGRLSALGQKQPSRARRRASALNQQPDLITTKADLVAAMSVVGA